MQAWQKDVNAKPMSAAREVVRLLGPAMTLEQQLCGLERLLFCDPMALIRAGVVAPLLSLLGSDAGGGGVASSPSEGHTRQRGLAGAGLGRIIGRLSSEDRQAVATPQTLTALVYMLDSPEATAQCNAAWILGNLVYCNRAHPIIAAAAPRLAELLTFHTEQATALPSYQLAQEFQRFDSPPEQAVKCLPLAEVHDRICSRAADILVGLLRLSRAADIVSSTLATVVDRRGMISSLVRLATSHDESNQRSAVGLLSELCSKSSLPAAMVPAILPFLVPALQKHLPQALLMPVGCNDTFALGFCEDALYVLCSSKHHFPALASSLLEAGLIPHVVQAWAATPTSTLYWGAVKAVVEVANEEASLAVVAAGVVPVCHALITSRKAVEQEMGVCVLAPLVLHHAAADAVAALPSIFPRLLRLVDSPVLRVTSKACSIVA